MKLLANTNVLVSYSRQVAKVTSTIEQSTTFVKQHIIYGINTEYTTYVVGLDKLKTETYIKIYCDALAPE